MECKGCASGSGGGSRFAASGGSRLTCAGAAPLPAQWAGYRVPGALWAWRGVVAVAVRTVSRLPTHHLPVASPARRLDASCHLAVTLRVPPSAVIAAQ
jgi:hypothetical protein